MPTYKYRCIMCKKEFEIFHSISTSLHKCPYCGGKLEKLITPNAGIIFKGTGFYQTDYKRKSKGNGNGKERPETEKKKAQEDVKGEKKDLLNKKER